MLAAALLQLVLQYHGSALRARGRFGAVSGSAAAQALLGGGLGLALVWRFGIPGLLWGWLAGTLVALAWVRLAAPDVPLRPGALAEGVRLVRGGFVVFAFFAVSLVLRSVDRLALIHYGTPADLGTYSLGLMAAGLVLYVPEAAAAVLYPRIAAAAGDARRPGAPRAGRWRARTARWRCCCRWRWRSRWCGWRRRWRGGCRATGTRPRPSGCSPWVRCCSRPRRCRATGCWAAAARGPCSWPGWRAPR